MGRKPCCAKEGLNRGAWSAGEDRTLINYIQVYGEGKWRDLPQRAGLKRCGKSCRLRWLNYLRPDIKRGNISVEEEDLIVRLHNLLGNRWSLIAGRLPGRTDNEIKNYWNTNLSKRFQDAKRSSSPGSKNNFNDSKINGQNSTSSLAAHHKVIRTKAVRCTKVFNIPHHQNNTHTMDQNTLFDSESGSSSLDLLLDFDINEFLLSDSPNSNSGSNQGRPSESETNECEENWVGEQYDNSCGLNFPIISADEEKGSLNDAKVLENYWSFCEPFEPNDPLDLKSLTTFLCSDDDRNII